MYKFHNHQNFRELKSCGFNSCQHWHQQSKSIWICPSLRNINITNFSVIYVAGCVCSIQTINTQLKWYSHQLNSPQYNHYSWVIRVWTYADIKKGEEGYYTNVRQSTYVIGTSLNLLVEFVLVFVPEWRVTHQQDVQDHTWYTHQLDVHSYTQMKGDKKPCAFGLTVYPHCIANVKGI